MNNAAIIIVSFRDALTEFSVHAREIPELRDKVRRLRAELDLMEAEAIVNGLATGSNEAQRKAALTVAIARDVHYVGVSADLRVAELTLAEKEADLSVAEQTMRVLRAELDWYRSCNDATAPHERA